MSIVLEIEGLTGGYTKGVTILEGIDLKVARGEAVGILGLNGSGKSTLGKALMNLLPYRTGVIAFNGKDISGLTTPELARTGFSLMHQGGDIFPGLTVQQHLDLAWDGTRDREYRQYLERTIPILRHPGWSLLHRNADKLSGGERHQLALAMALARKPEVLILDEPSDGLTPKAVDDTYAILDGIRKEYGMTVLLIEQNVAHAVAFCDRCVVLRNGSIHKEIKKEDVGSISGSDYMTNMLQYLF